jgi:hypothetical protein
MPVQRQATFKPTKSTDAIVLQIDGHKIAVRHSAIGGLNEKQIKTLIENAASTGNVALPPTFVHINRDATLALAIGTQPTVWPEDDTG